MGSAWIGQAVDGGGAFQLFARPSLIPRRLGTLSKGHGGDYFGRSAAHLVRRECGSQRQQRCAVSNSPLGLSSRHASAPLRSLDGSCKAASLGQVNVSDEENVADCLRPALCLGLGIACYLVSGLAGNLGSPLSRVAGFADSAVQPDRGPAVCLERCASVSTAVTARPRKAPLRTVLQYHIQKIMMKRLGGKLLAVALVVLPIVLLGGIAYRLASGNPWYLSFFRAYLLIGGVPGFGCASEDNHIATTVTNIIFLLGLLTFTVVLGVVCEDISRFVDNIRMGNTAVVEEGHTVVLNVNKQLPSVLRQMSIAKQERRKGTFKKPVVVMADMEKAKLDAVVNRALGGLCLDVYTRRGQAHSPTDLRRVAADQAETIVLLHPEDEDTVTTAAKRVATIASLKAMGTGAYRKTQLVVQTPEKLDAMEGLVNVTQAAQTPPLPKGSKLEVVEMHAAQTLDRMLAQCALQPGLGDVYSEILEQGEGMEFYVVSYPKLAGNAYFNVRRYFDSAVVCGYLKGDGLILNPSENAIYEADDSIVLLAPSFDKIKPLSKPMASVPDWVYNVRRSYGDTVARKILILNWTEDCDGILEGLDDFSPKGGEVTVVCRERVNGGNMKFKNIRVRYVEDNPASFHALQGAGLDKFDSVILTGLDDLESDTADAQMLSTLLQIQDIGCKAGCSKPLHVVASINHPKTKDVAQHLVREARNMGSCCTLDLLLPDELSSGVLTQVAAQPRLLEVVRDLMNPSEIELYMRCPTDYELTGKGAITWLEVQEAVRANGETAVGYVDKSGVKHTAPATSSKHAFDIDDRIVVLAPDYVPS